MNSSRLVICGLALLAVSALGWFAVSREPAAKVATQSLAPPLPPNPPALEPERSEPVSNEVPLIGVEQKEPEVVPSAQATTGPTSFARRQELSLIHISEPTR